MNRRRGFRDTDDDMEDGGAGSIFDTLFNDSNRDFLMREAMKAMRSKGGAREAAETIIRRNPMAVGVMGLGLAWLVYGSTRKPTAEEEMTARREGAKDAARHAFHSARTAADDEAWADAIDRLRARASLRLRELEEDAAAYGETLHGKADEARDFVTERAVILAKLAEDMRARLAEGLDDLSHTARARAVEAREDAYAARLRAQEALGRHGREARRMVEDHPMVSAALVLALGAALGKAAFGSRRGAETDMSDNEPKRRSWRRPGHHRD